MLPKLLAALPIGTALFLLDVAALAVCWPLAVLGLHAMGIPLSWADALIFPAGDMLALYALGLYRRDAVVETRRSIGRVPAVVGLGAIGTSLLRAACAGLLGAAGPIPAALLVGAIGMFSLAAALARGALSALKHRGAFRRRVLVVGAGRRAWDLVWMLVHEGRMLRYDFTFLHGAALGEADPRLAAEHPGRILPLEAGILATARRIGAEQVVVAPDERRGLAPEALLACKSAGFPVVQYLSFLEHEIRRIDIKRIEVGWLLYSDGFCFGALDKACKRALDVAVSLVLLALFAPFLLGAAVAIKLDDRGPLLYRQERVTRHGHSFHIMKLRTMRTDAEAGGAVWAAAKDNRITRVGAFLRRTRIDEMPQLFNVLKGEMSLVGPRPERPQFVRQLAEQLPLYNERHAVKAGLTGWAQINYPYGASIDDARSKLSYDLFYVKNFSILFDLVIILQTIRVVLWPSGVR